jgi:hypothetical protein
MPIVQFYLASKAHAMGYRALAKPAPPTRRGEADRAIALQNLIASQRSPTTPV